MKDLFDEYGGVIAITIIGLIVIGAFLKILELVSAL